MRKYCRICWNTRYWREPTREAAGIELGDSYVHKNGFGHEEWIFNFSWLQPSPAGGRKKYKYGLLQPIGKHRDKYEGMTFDVLVYTTTPERTRVAVAIIKDLFVPTVSELEAASDVWRRRGWLDRMKNDLSRLGISKSKLIGPPTHLMNVRFDPETVIFFDPRLPFPSSHKLYRINRYQAINWDDNFPILEIVDASTNSPKRDGKRRSENDRQRTAMDGTTYSPAHVILQNALYDHLCALHGKMAVRYENSFVDLALEEDGTVTYFEIKIAPTTKSCIRNALGQLLEYGICPAQQRASKLVVVGDGEPTGSDRAYLRHLRNQYALPIYYRQWNWQTRILDLEV